MNKEIEISDDQNTINVSGMYFEALRIGLGCNGCYFSSLYSCYPEIPCHSKERKDKKSVIFRKKSK